VCAGGAGCGYQNPVDESTDKFSSSGDFHHPVIEITGYVYAVLSGLLWNNPEGMAYS
jgi:hypothetical protein